MEKYVGTIVIGSVLLVSLAAWYLYLRYEYKSVREERERDRSVFMTRLTITCAMMFATKDFKTIEDCLKWLEVHKKSLESQMKRTIGVDELSDVAKKAYEESKI